MFKGVRAPQWRLIALLGVAAVGSAILLTSSLAQRQNDPPAFVIVERLETTGPESIQQEYAKLARDILPKYGAHYLARSQRNTLLEGAGPVPCCMAILQFPSQDAAKRWYESPRIRPQLKSGRAAGGFDW